MSSQHLITKDAVTDLTLWSFAYDNDGQLLSTTDRYNRTTSISRDGAGQPLSITSPTGIVTTLSTSSAGRLETVTDPEGNGYFLEYDEDGLLTYMSDPRQFEHEFYYDGEFRLETDFDPAGGSKKLSRSKIGDGFEVQLTTGLQVTDTYRYQRPAGEVEVQRVHISPDGMETETVSFPDGRIVSTGPDGTVTTTWKEPDPRFGMTAAFNSHSQVAFPVAGLTMDTYSTRFQSGDDWVELFSMDSNFANPMEYRYDTMALGSLVS